MRRWFLIPAVMLGVSIFVVIESPGTAVPGLLQKKKPQPVNDEIHDPARAVANLDVHPELEATLFAHEDVLKEGEKRDLDNGGLTNPTNLDIDHRGRVWVCDVINYRGNNGKRPKGDRILIYEPDGKMKVFYQGRDVDSAMGICVLGNKVIVSCSPNVFVFTKDDDDKILKKEVLFTKTGIPQHDHSAHSFLFGPDGRLYWNFGNTGGAVHDKNGKPVVDLAGNVVNDKGKPYRQGMVFRCEMDGSNFEVLGHNFRNNYEVTVDSFGTLWQSDNDDDGNRGVRINYVMEYGNFGYVEEFSGKGWQVPRTNMEKEIPLRHWHLNDPGVVPNLLQTYAGSPTGICVYEGSLLPKPFLPSPLRGRGVGGEGAGPSTMIIHCDALPSIVRAYPVTPDGAGYKASIVNILDGAKKNQWFRPADVCVAPDGSLFVTDWYDPGVGGHQQRDLDRGRIFRVAPPGVKYSVPKVKLDTIEDNIEALKSPNLATRYIAWTNLHKEGAKAEAALLKLYESDVPHERARALWLLGRLPGKGRHYVETALHDPEQNIRAAGVRLARQLKLDVVAIVKDLVIVLRNTPMSRELAIALRYSKSPDAARMWALLAVGYDGEDRWFLEALGIGAEKNWDACLDLFLQNKLKNSSKADRDIVWRSRATRTPELLASIIMDGKTPSSELPSMLRSFDFQKDSDIKNEALEKLAFGEYADPARAKFVTTEAISRLPSFDVAKKPKYAAAIDKLLDGAKGTTSFVEIVAKFGVSTRYPDLLAMAQKQPTEQLGVDAIRVLLDRDQVKLIQTGLESSDPVRAARTAQAIAGSRHDKANTLLWPIFNNDKLDLELRRQATRALASNRIGAEGLIKLAREKKFPKVLENAAGAALFASNILDVRVQSYKLFPQPASKNNVLLPAIAEFVKMKGNPGNGQKIFAKQGTCAKCHIVNGEGKNVGPDLSEIGKKLGREAIFESILYPSASILHNYETWVVETKKGTSASGLLVSKTAEEITIKDAESIVRTFKMSDVESAAKSSISLMPADLHQLMNTQELCDVVEYLTTLREARKK